MALEYQHFHNRRLVFDLNPLSEHDNFAHTYGYELYAPLKKMLIFQFIIKKSSYHSRP